MHSTISDQQQQAISALLATANLSKGLGTAENPCSVAAINLALTGKFTGEIPPCMSQVVGRWIIGIQDGMPSDVRNSAEWKGLLPLAAGTGRDREQERQQIIVRWMWEVALPIVQPIADKLRFGAEWRRMLEQQTASAASASASAAHAASTADVADASAANAAASAAIATAAAIATTTTTTGTARTAAANSWRQMDPCALLRCLIDLPPN